MDWPAHLAIWEVLTCTQHGATWRSSMILHTSSPGTTKAFIPFAAPQDSHNVVHNYAARWLRSCRMFSWYRNHLIYHMNVVCFMYDTKLSSLRSLLFFCSASAESVMCG